KIAPLYCPEVSGRPGWLSGSIRQFPRLNQSYGRMNFDEQNRSSELDRKVPHRCRGTWPVEELGRSRAPTGVALFSPKRGALLKIFLDLPFLCIVSGTQPA